MLVYNNPLSSDVTYHAVNFYQNAYHFEVMCFNWKTTIAYFQRSNLKTTLISRASRLPLEMGLPLYPCEFPWVQTRLKLYYFGNSFVWQPP